MKVFVKILWVSLLLALAPVAAQAAIGVNGDSFSIPSDGLLLVEADGAIANDTMNDVDNSPQFVLDIAINHTLSVITPPSEGTLKCGNTVNAICADGSFEFTVSPTTFSGVDSFTYRLEVDIGLPTYEFADATVNLSACSTTGTETICWTEGSFFAALVATEDPFNPYYVKHEGFEGAAWTVYRSYQDANLNWVYNGATTITSKGIAWSTNHTATNSLSTSTGGAYTGTYGVFDPDHGHATNTSIGSCQALETANNGVVPPECLPYDGVSGSSATTLYAAGGYIKGSNAAANIDIIIDGGLPNNIGKLVTPAHQFYGVIDTTGFTSFQFRDIDGKTGQPLFIFGDDFYLVSRDAADANQGPVIGAIADQTVAAGSLFQIDIPVSDPDGDAVAAVLSGVPTTGTGRARLIENADGSVRIRWITPSTGAGIYSVSVSFTDNGYPQISQVLNFTLTLTDPPPSLNLPANITTEASASTGATVNYTVSASDAAGASLTASCNPASGATFTIATTTVNCSVTDGNSLTTTGSFTVKVQDTTAPSVTAPANIISEASAATTTVSLGSGSATDAVDGNLIPTPNNIGPFTVGIHSIIWSATDAASNTGTAIQTVTVNDSVPPVLSLPANISTQATGPTGAIVNYSAAASDAISGNLSVSCSKASGSSFALGTTTVTCTSAADGANNTTSGSFNVTVVDTINPVVTAPLSITREATGPATAVNLGSASASDVVSVSLVPTASNSGPFGVGIHSIIWSATDSSNNTGTATQSVTITDTTAPNLSFPVNFSAEATSASGAAVTYTTSANDLVDGSIVPACAPVSGSTFALGTTAVSCSVTDSANLTASGSFNITVADSTAPTVIAPLDITMEATGTTTAVSLGLASASDAVSGTLTPSASNVGPFAVGINTIIWSATDAANNTGNATQLVTITDTGAPSLTLPASFTAEATAATGASVTYISSATDAADGTLPSGCSPVSGSTFALGINPVNCSVTDSSSNISTGSFNITVVDTTPPAVTAPLDITVEATSANTSVSLGTASASDLVNGTLIPTANNIGPFAVGVHSITWSATDTAANTGNAIQLVTVTDTGAPTLSLPASITKQAAGSTGAVVNYTATASDTVDGVLASGCLPASGSTFAVGTTAVNCSVTDSASLTTSGSFNVNVVDTTAPTVTAPINITMEATGLATSVNLGSATATDLVDGSLIPSANNSGPFSVGVHTIIWSATDTANNTGNASQTVTITDTGYPALGLPANITAEATGATGAIVTYAATASDIVDGSLTPGCTPVSGSTFALGTASVNCSVTDSANLTSSGGFSVTVADTTAPVVTAPVNITKEASGATTAVSLGIAAANDLVTGVVTPTASNSGPFAVGVHSIIWSATDTANNTGNATQTVTITDTLAPSLNLPANISQGATSVNGAMVNYTVTANDIADGSIVASCSPLSGSNFALGTTAVSCSASDKSNNSASGSFNITITDTGAPTLSLPANISTQATAATGAIVSYIATASDAIDGPLPANCIPASGNTFSLGDHVVNCSAQDLEGNTSNGSFIVSIVDTTPPNVTAPVNVTVEATGAATDVTLGSASATDLVSGTLIPVASNSGPFTVGVHTITWSATDSANNTGTATQTVTVSDTAAPILSLPVNISHEATSAAGAVVNYTATANDIVDGALASGCLPASGSSFAIGTTAVSCSVTDSANLTATGSFNVTIVDTTAPVVTAPANISTEATGATTAVALGSATANDLVNGVLPASANNSGPFAVGVHSITWSATDAANNTGSATQIVTITDIGSPTLGLPANMTAEATSASGAVVSYTVTASDVVDGVLTASCTPLSGSTFALGITTVNCSVTDSASQTTSGSFSVTVVDTTGPALTLPADISINTTSSTGAIASYSVTATDAADGPIVPNCLPASGSNFALGSTAVSCSATDSANNTSTGSFNVTVIDTTTNGQPVANAGSPQTVSLGGSVTLNGSASSDPDGDTLQYQWTLVSKPQGSLAEVINATMVSASFDPDQPGDYVAQLIVTDINNSGSLASRVTITAVNNAPEAHSGTDQNVFVGDLVTLDGILSSDANGDTLTYQWTLTVPTDSFAVLTKATSVNPEFTADVAGIYTAQLIVNDGLVDSLFVATVTITAQIPVDIAPTISVPADIRVPSTGYLTPIAPGVATATDPEDGVLQPTVDNTGPFKAGRHIITWSVTDSGNNTVAASQIVEVLPMVNFQLDQQAEVGAPIQVNLNMNGLAPQYPVDLNYDLTVNGSTISETLSIASGKSAVIDYLVPTAANAGDTITFTLKTAVNAVVGANSIHNVTLINTNVAPIVDFEVTQNGVLTKKLHANGGLVTVTAIVHDDNQSDTHTLDWSTTDNNLSPPGSVMAFSFDPGNLVDGNYKIGIKVVDSGTLEAENEIYVRVTAQDFIPAPGADSDNDGIEDALEGDHDDDDDGVPNYLDGIDEQPEMLQMQAGESNRWIIATQSGLSLRLGKTAQLNGRYGANITPAELAQFASLGRVTAHADTNDSDYNSADGYLDFTIHGLTKPGQSVKMVIPLLSVIPDQAVYRKYSADTGWSNFVEDAANELFSAPGADGVCPAPGSIDYLPGLEPGDYCVQILIQDGGPNDDDKRRNGVIKDPGGLAVAATATTTPPTPTTGPTTTPATSGSSGGGGGAIDILSLLSMMMLVTVSLGYRMLLIRRKFGGVKVEQGEKQGSL